MKLSKKILLVILDGWGVGSKGKTNAIHNAQTPFFDSLIKEYPNSQLYASAEYVGLPPNQIGNSEVGHMALGAGRIVYQNIVRIDNDIKNNTLKDNSVLKETLLEAKTKGKNLHLMGLVSDGGIHSHIDHLKALLEISASYDLEKVYVHAFKDGRDTDPHSGIDYIKDLEAWMNKTCGSLSTINGRYYSMDRDIRIDRTMKAFNAIFYGQGQEAASAQEAILHSYKNGISDEFILPTIISYGKNFQKIDNDDIVICFNFRTDRCRQISRKILELAPSVNYITMTNYDKYFKGVKILYNKNYIKMTLGEVISQHGLKQLRIAETEKYPHVTFFFSGGKEEPFFNEERILIPSPKVATYDLAPEMSAKKITLALIKEINKQTHDFICLNFANADMVGHTGIYDAVIKAVETVDICLKDVVEAASKNEYSLLILADHVIDDYMLIIVNTPIS
ncbi:MAG: 2,3-bisphosphoglycerate-independent phosphoglycerate mutase [Solitalea-like symbiont of Acarus siro]